MPLPMPASTSAALLSHERSPQPMTMSMSMSMLMPWRRRTAWWPDWFPERRRPKSMGKEPFSAAAGSCAHVDESMDAPREASQPFIQLISLSWSSVMLAQSSSRDSSGGGGGESSDSKEKHHFLQSAAPAAGKPLPS